MWNKLRFLLIPFALVIGGAADTVLAAGEVNIYSARQEELIEPLLEEFTETTDIEMNLVTGDADELLKRLQAEGRNTPADILLTTDAGRLHRAEEAGLLQPVCDPALQEAVPEAYRDPECYWYGLSLRARPIFYARDRVDPANLSTYEALAGERWSDRICIRSSDNIYNQSLVASMIAAEGLEATEAWADDFVDNFARDPVGGDTDQLQAVAVGQCDIAIANTYYYGRLVNSDDPDERAQASELAIFWPNQQGRGTHVNISGAGITPTAPNKENAISLLRFLVSDEAQEWYAQINYEYPVVSGVPWSDSLQEWGKFEADDLNLSRLGELNGEALMLMDRAGWR